MNEEHFFEELTNDLNRSGIEFYFEICHAGGEVLIEYENVDIKLFEQFKLEKNDFIVKEKNDLKELKYEGDLYDLLLSWIGNRTIAKHLFYRIKQFCDVNKYNIYTYISQDIVKNDFFEKILLEKAFDSSVIIFESENKVVSISVNWFC